MTPMHEFFSKMMNAQQHMMDTFVKNANTFLETMTSDESLTKESQALFSEFWNKQRTLAEEALKADKPENLWMHFPEHMTKMMEAQNSFMTQSMDMSRKMWEQFSGKAAEERMHTLMELYQSNIKAMSEAMNAGNEVVREMTSEHAPA